MTRWAGYKGDGSDEGHHMEIFSALRAGFEAAKSAVAWTFARMMADMIHSAMCSCPTFGYDAGCPRHGINQKVEG